MTEQDDKDQDKPRRWRIDHNIPVTLIVVLVAQLIGFIIWANNQASNLAHVIETVQTDGHRIERLEDTAQGLGNFQATVTEQIKGLQLTVDQMRQDQRQTNDLLRQMLEKRP